MNRNSRLAAIIGCCAVLAVPAFANTQDWRPVPHHRQYVREAYRCPLHRNAAGNLVSCDGWRLRSSAIGWDHSCFDLGYMPSEFACSAGGN